MIKKPSRELVDAFLQWYENDPHAKQEDYYADKISAELLAGLSQEQFIEFFFQFAREGGLVQGGGYRTAPLLKQSISGNFDEFQEFVLQPFSEDFDEISWLSHITQFKGFGPGVASIYLNRVNKNRFAILNNKAIKAMELFGIVLPTAVDQRYVIVRDAERQLIEWYPEFENLYRTDALTHFLIGVEEGQRWVAKLRGGVPPAETRYWIIARGEGAEFWDDCLQKGIIRVGWDDLDEDLSVYRTEEQLRELHKRPQVTFYNEHSSEFSSEVEKPLPVLMANVARALPPKILKGLETERRIFSRIPKNDYGRGGAWDFYWAHFIPRAASARLIPSCMFLFPRRACVSALRF